MGRASSGVRSAAVRQSRLRGGGRRVDRPRAGTPPRRPVVACGGPSPNRRKMTRMTDLTPDELRLVSDALMKHAETELVGWEEHELAEFIGRGPEAKEGYCSGGRVSGNAA